MTGIIVIARKYGDFSFWLEPWSGGTDVGLGDADVGLEPLTLQGYLCRANRNILPIFIGHM